MKRKVIKQQSSFTITLPKKWIDRQGVRPGAELDVVERDDGSLQISPSTGEGRKTKHVRLESHTPSRLRTLIAGLYRRGFDTITLESTQPFDLVTMERICQSLTGMLVKQCSVTRVELECTATVPSDLTAHISKLFTTLAYIVRERKQLKLPDVQSLARQSLEMRDYLSRCVGKLTFGAEKSTEYQLLVFFLEKCTSAVPGIVGKEDTAQYAALIDSLRVAFVNGDVDLAQKTNEQLSAWRKKPASAGLTLFIDHLFSVSSRVLSIVA